MDFELQISGVAIDCDNVNELASFYSRITEQPIFYQSGDFACLNLAAYWLTFQRVDNYVAPNWPSSNSPKRFHLGIWTNDIDGVVKLVPENGAARSANQPSPDDSWRVYVDPVGHPFCLTQNVPDPATS